MKQAITAVFLLSLAAFSGTASAAYSVDAGGDSNTHATEEEGFTFSKTVDSGVSFFLVQVLPPNDASIITACVIGSGCTINCGNADASDFSVEGGIVDPANAQPGEVEACSGKGDVAVAWQLDDPFSGTLEYGFDAKALASNGVPAADSTKTWVAAISSVSTTSETDTTTVFAPSLSISSVTASPSTVSDENFFTLTAAVQNASDGTHSGNAFNVGTGSFSFSPAGCAAIVGQPADFQVSSGASASRDWNLQAKSIGDCNVTVNVQGDGGYSASRSRTVAVTAPNTSPVANFTFTPSDGNRNTTYSFTSTSTDDGTISSFAWTWGDGNTGNGSTSTHKFGRKGSFSVTLTVTDSFGLTDSESRTVTVRNLAPTPSFTVTPSPADVNEDVNVNASASVDADGDAITSYSWDWGDNSTDSNGVTANHAYANPGTYEITLTVSDGNNSADLEKTVNVLGEGNQAPVASFTFAPPSGAIGTPFSFDASGSSDPEGGSLSYSWLFGDGTTGSGRTITHQYFNAGTYTVQLTVVDNNSISASATRAVIVSALQEEEEDAPVADFVYSPSTGGIGTVFSFDAGLSSDPEGGALTYSWNWGDGATGTGGNASHSYSGQGTFSVVLTVTDPAGLTGTLSKPVLVSEPQDSNASGDLNVVLPATFIEGDNAIVVLDANGNPVPGAAMLLKGKLYRADSTGRIAFRVPAGDQNFTVTAPGFGEKSFTINVLLKSGEKAVTSTGECPPLFGVCIYYVVAVLIVVLLLLVALRTVKKGAKDKKSKKDETATAFSELEKGWTAGSGESALSEMLPDQPKVEKKPEAKAAEPKPADGEEKRLSALLDALPGQEKKQLPQEKFLQLVIGKESKKPEKAGDEKK